MYLPAREMANLVTKILEDLWEKRRYVLKDAEQSYFCFRITASNDSETYLHFVIEKDRHWYVTVNDKHEYEFPRDARTFRDADGDKWDYRIDSWRHYAFHDIVKGMLYSHFKEQLSDGVDNFFLWSLFPVVEIK